MVACSECIKSGSIVIALCINTGWCMLRLYCWVNGPSVLVDFSKNKKKKRKGFFFWMTQSFSSTRLCFLLVFLYGSWVMVDWMQGSLKQNEIINLLAYFCRSWIAWFLSFCSSALLRFEVFLSHDQSHARLVLFKAHKLVCWKLEKA